MTKKSIVTRNFSVAFCRSSHVREREANNSVKGKLGKTKSRKCLGQPRGGENGIAMMLFLMPCGYHIPPYTFSATVPK